MLALLFALFFSLPSQATDASVKVNCRGFQKFPDGVTIEVPAAKVGFFRSLPLAENAGFNISYIGNTLTLKLWAVGEQSAMADSDTGTTVLEYGIFKISCQLIQ